MGQLPAAVIGLAEQIENATGVDLFSALRRSPDDVEPGPTPFVSQ